MSEQERRRIKKDHEMRTKDISRMIDEGGLGADKYYNIVKDESKDSEENNKESQKKNKQD